jgi:integrase/recombinase XerD
MMSVLARRHEKCCKHRDKGWTYRNCRCPIHIDTTIDGRPYRRSLHTRDWEEAQKKQRDLEAANLVYSPERRGFVPSSELTPTEATQHAEEAKKRFVYSPSRGEMASAAPTESAPAAAVSRKNITIEAAEELFLADGKARMLAKSTLDRYEAILDGMTAFAAQPERRFTLLRELDTETLTKFRLTWKGSSSLAAVKKIERLRTFFKFCWANGYVDRNPAAGVKYPNVRLTPTLPFSQEEMLAMIDAADQRIAKAERVSGKVKAQHVRALILLMRYSGPRISDAIACRCDSVQDGKLSLYTAKTGQHVSVPLPEFLVEELERLPRKSPGHWFWPGASGTLESWRKPWTVALLALFKAAGIKGGRAHRFRDTFAVEHLLSGTSIPTVSKFLGHSNTRITEKHYLPWVKRLQEQAEEDSRKSWEKDPLHRRLSGQRKRPFVMGRRAS